MKAHISKEKEFEAAAIQLVHCIEKKDYKSLSKSILQNKYVMTGLMCMLAEQDEFSNKIIEYLMSDYCTTDVVMSLLTYISHSITAEMSLTQPTQKDMHQLYVAVFVQGLIVFVCRDKVEQ